MKKVFWLLPLLLCACAHGPRRPIELSEIAKNRPTGPGCHALTSTDRTRLLEIASPENFPSTRYRRGPSSSKPIEKETDCSHFVHEVYRRAGLPYGFRATSDLGSAREFDILPEKDARPGDLMLFKGHVGIVDGDGKIISALRTRHRKRPSSIATLDRKHFRAIRGKRYVLRYRCLPTAERTMASEAHQ